MLVVRKRISELFLSAPRYPGDTVAWIGYEQWLDGERCPWSFTNHSAATKAKAMHDPRAEVVRIVQPWP